MIHQPKHFIINGSITHDLVKEFINCVDSSEGRRINIYLTSGGGSIAGMYIIRHIINLNPMQFEMHAIESIHSAAFELFFKVKCDRIIERGTIGMMHLSYTEMQIQSNGMQYYNSDKARAKEGKDDIKYCTEFMQSIGGASIC
jgi:ATP-dependent protease ClpP protease subunit